MRDRAPAGGSLTTHLFLRREESCTRGVTDAEHIAELEEQLRQRDARIAKLERTVDELRKVIDAWKRGHRVRPGGKTLGQTKKPLERQGWTVSRGRIQEILHRSAEVLAAGPAALRAAIPTAAVEWADESAPKVDGASGCLWLVMTPQVVLYEADRSRGQEVAQRLFKGFTGTLHPDFYSVYWTLAGVAHAPCGTHLCPTARATRGDLKTLATDADLDENADVARLQRRIVRHLPELVTFITNPDLEGTNNRVEWEFRPHAIARHRSGGARSDAGAKTYAINLSVARTVHLHGGDFIDTFKRARIALHEGGDLPMIFPGPARDARQVGASSLS